MASILGKLDVRSRAAYAPGERVLARLTQTDPGTYEARVIRRLAAAPDRTLGVVTVVGESMREWSCASGTTSV